MTKETKLHGVQTDFLTQGFDLVKKHTQNISQAFLDDLKDARNESTTRLEGDYMRVASIPTVVAEQWLREGFNVYEETGAAIVKRLQEQDLTAFMATEKRT